MKTKKKIDFRRHPYRGIYSEIATEQGVSVQAIYQSINKLHNPRILEIFKQKRIQREEHYESVRIR
jgi:hypothetical protein